MTRDDMHKLLQEIKANRKTLGDCPKHHFNLGEPPYTLGQKHTCSNCGGSQDLTSIGDYVRSYKAAGGNPNDIVPNWE